MAQNVIRQKKVLNILLIESNTLDQLEVRQALEETKILFLLKIAQDEAEAFTALSEASETKPDIILLRISTSKLRGTEFVRMIKFNNDWKDIKIFILSTPGEIDNKSEWLESGITGIIIKPLKLKSPMSPGAFNLMIDIMNLHVEENSN
jgi:DNA-binding NarL/FixJ family response regulator